MLGGEGTGTTTFFQLLEDPCLPLPYMELEKPGQRGVTRTLTLRARVYFSEVWGRETRERVLRETSMVGLGKGREERKRRTKTHVSGHHIYEGLYWGYWTCSQPTTAPLCVTILSKELVIQSYNSQPDCSMPSISPGKRAAQTSITVPSELKWARLARRYLWRVSSH